MTLTIGIKPTMKIILRYPAVVGTVAWDGVVFTNINHDTSGFISRGSSIQFNSRLTFINRHLMFVSQIAMFIFYPICENTDVGEYEDGSGWHITAKAFRSLYRPFSILGLIFNYFRHFLFYHHPFLSKRFSRAPFVKYLKCKVLHLESLDVYKIDQGSEEENQVAESTKL